MAGNLQLTCGDCGQEFTFTTEEQAFFRERGYSTPKRCKACRQARKNEPVGAGAPPPTETRNTTVICAGCGQQTTVPFEPRGDRPVYCRDCYQARKGASTGRGRAAYTRNRR
jgi:CxxC-x17-CxxC domain-containing protein